MVIKCYICCENKVGRDKVLKIVKNLINVKKEFKDAIEITSCEKWKDDYDHDVYIVDESALGSIESDKISSQAFLVLFEGKLKQETIKYAMENGAYGIFPLDRFYGQRKEYTEIGRFEEVLKKLFRERLSNFKHEREISKPIDWKMEISASSESSQRFISLFSDEKMRRILRNINVICRNLRPFVEKLEKFHNSEKREIEKLKRLELNLASNEDLKDVTEIFKKMRKKTDELRFTKVESVLIIGPTGSGKTLIAEYIYDKLKREYANVGEFVKLSMANITSSLIDSELFGTFPGAFTNSTYKLGKLVSSAGGIIFLDEIGEIDDKAQAKLLTYMDNLRVIIEGCSDTSLLRVPTLIIAATNKDLRKLSMEGYYRLDLYNRFKYKIEIPPLKYRLNDLPYMISFLLQTVKDSKVKSISIRAIEKLKRYDYPGNFRELESIISFAITNAELEGRECILEKDITI